MHGRTDNIFLAFMHMCSMHSDTIFYFTYLYKGNSSENHVPIQTDIQCSIRDYSVPEFEFLDKQVSNARLTERYCRN